MNEIDDEFEATRTTYPDARMLVGMSFVTGDGEPGRVIGQIALYDFLVEWADGHLTVCGSAEMRAKGEPELGAEGKRTGKWLRTPGWSFSRPS
jgi:hypothetical protein